MQPILLQTIPTLYVQIFRDRKIVTISLAGIGKPNSRIPKDICVAVAYSTFNEKVEFGKKGIAEIMTRKQRVKLNLSSKPQPLEPAFITIQCSEHFLQQIVHLKTKCV